MAESWLKANTATLLLSGSFERSSLLRNNQQPDEPIGSAEAHAAQMCTPLIVPARC
jgi:hypothetical protein